MSQEGPGHELPEGYGPARYIPSSYESFGPPWPQPRPQPPPLPPYPQYTVMPPPPKRRRRGRWIVVALLVVLLVVSVPTFFLVRYITRSTPNKTLDAFCTAVQQGDYQSAYDQFSTRLQQTVSEARFASVLSKDKVNACMHGTTDDTGTSVTNTMKLVHVSKGVNNDIVTLIKDSNGTWKIDDISRQT
jgi:hypothetical protein